MIIDTQRVTKGVSHGVSHIVEYVSGISSLVLKDVKKFPGAVKRMPSAISRAVRSKIEINIILPEQKPEQPTQDQDSHEVINS